ncbi:MAG: hypothetical protein HON53_14210 [Planctomycetaceae bacterium]|jgi:hypothetical protein|nr:hypothetical protein [Planctomycetaceae bacterium]MBT6495318.1 hypothetical protein [Planctomycetaceae bacterium]
MKTETIETNGRVPSRAEGSQRGNANVGAVDAAKAIAAESKGRSGNTEEVSDGTLCVNCEERRDWDGRSFCPACGFHPALNRCVEVERPQPVVETGPENLWEAIPTWAWVLIFGVVGIVAGSVAVRLSFSGSPRLLAGWGVAQIAIAEFTSLVAHVLALIHASSKSDRYSPFDLLMKPLALWRPTFSTLPKSAWRVWMFAWGQTAMICAVLIIGGLNFSALFDDWGVKKNSSANLVQAIADQARENGEDEESLEDALNKTATAGDDIAPKEELLPVEDPIVECLIFGYRKNLEEKPTALLLATIVKGRMKYVGMISVVGIPDEAMQTLTERMPNLTQKNPFIKCRFKAVWLRPQLMCEVEYKEWTRSNQLLKPKFRELLAEIDVR